MVKVKITYPERDQELVECDAVFTRDGFLVLVRKGEGDRGAVERVIPAHAFLEVKVVRPAEGPVTPPEMPPAAEPSTLGAVASAPGPRLRRGLENLVDKAAGRTGTSAATAAVRKGGYGAPL